MCGNCGNKSEPKLTTTETTYLMRCMECGHIGAGTNMQEAKTSYITLDCYGEPSPFTHGESNE